MTRFATLTELGYTTAHVSCEVQHHGHLNEKPLFRGSVSSFVSELALAGKTVKVLIFCKSLYSFLLVSSLSKVDYCVKHLVSKF